MKSKRETIMESAFELFFSKGYKNTKIIEIAELAGIGKGTVYEYFKSKEAILFELLNAKLECDKGKLQAIKASNLSGEDQIKAFFQFEIDSIENYGPGSNVLAQEMMSPGFDAAEKVMGIMHKIFIIKYEFICEVIAAGIQNGEFKPIDSSLAATGIFGAVNFYTAFKYNIIQHKLKPELPFANSTWNQEEFFSLIFHGLK